MAGDDTKDLTTKQEETVKKGNNPTGKGGFQDHPELRSPGGWSAVNTFSYCYRFFMGMPLSEFKDWIGNNPDRTVVQEIAWNAVAKSRADKWYLREINNRVEGLPKQTIQVDQPDELDDNKLKEIDERLSKATVVEGS